MIQKITRAQYLEQIKTKANEIFGKDWKRLTDIKKCSCDYEGCQGWTIEPNEEYSKKVIAETKQHKRS